MVGLCCLSAACGRLRYEPREVGADVRVDGVVDARNDDVPALRDAPSDNDADGIPDADDNCPSRANPTQHDEELDGVGDVCDGCPHLADPLQSDSDSDGVNDACDPSMLSANRIVAFFAFDTAELPEGWAYDVEAGVTLTQRVESDALVLGVPDSRLATLLMESPASPFVLVATDFTVDEVAVGTDAWDVRNVAIVDHLTGMLRSENALFIGALDDIDDDIPTRLDILPLIDGGNGGTLNFPQPRFPAVLTVGDAFDLTYMRKRATREATTTRPSTTSTSGMFEATGGRIGIRVRGVTARFRYLIVIA